MNEWRIECFLFKQNCALRMQLIIIINRNGTVEAGRKEKTAKMSTKTSFNVLSPPLSQLAFSLHLSHRRVSTVLHATSRGTQKDRATKEREREMTGTQGRERVGR